jgi:uncharacterized membrane protein YphA (DoxX/SURF4 family)
MMSKIADKKKHVLLMIFHGSRFFLGVVFIYASSIKILNPDAFAEAVFNYQILPDNLVNLTAIILPWLELMVGFCLIIGWWIPGCVVIVNLLMIVFISAFIFNLMRGLDIHCGCFSSISETASAWVVLRDIFFLVVSFFLLYMVFFFKNPVSNWFNNKANIDY